MNNLYNTLTFYVQMRIVLEVLCRYPGILTVQLTMITNGRSQKSGTIRAEDLDSPLFNLSWVAKETGLKPSTIRAWGNRYGVPKPKRTDGGHRRYSQRDIDTIKWLVARQTEGMAISNAAQLWQAQSEHGRDLAHSLEPNPQTGTLLETLPQPNSELIALRAQWIAACRLFDRTSAEQVLAGAFALFSPEAVTIHVLQAGLSEIGELWYQGDLSIQQEHFASAISVQRLEMLIAATPPPTRYERIIIAAAEDDFHIFSPLLFTFLLRRRGWDVFYLGADTPATSIRETVADLKPQMVILSSQLLSTATSVLDLSTALSGSELSIGYGGIIFNMMPKLRERIPAHYLGPTIEGAVEVVERLIRQPAPNPAVSIYNQSFERALREYRQRRSLIETEIWDYYESNEETGNQLEEINREMAGIIMAALTFGDCDILCRNMQWIQYLSNNYKISESQAQEYVKVYQQATRTNLRGAQIIVDALEEMK